ncbi:tachykinin-like peptides receptor 86C [Cydia splendana]|uniref:tachykinin-like peptides receptor 86C n=1 Tax=Cydia splendana TaxID=1100963 RepID=UPI00300CEE75
MLGMTFFYSAMGRVLWGSRSIGELTQRQIDSIRSKRKVVKMFILVIVIFGICWLPYQSYFIYTHFNPSIMYKKYVQHVYLGFYWLAMANAMVNPIIYYWMNAKFRTYFRTAMCGWRDALRRRKRPLPDSPPDYLSQSGSRSRSGIEEPRDSRRNVVSEWPQLSCRDRAGLRSQRPPLHASCPRCPHSYYDGKCRLEYNLEKYVTLIMI